MLCECTTSEKLPSRLFDESKAIFLADVAAEVVMNEVPKRIKLVCQLSLPVTGRWKSGVLKLYLLQTWMTKGS